VTSRGSPGSAVDFEGEELGLFSYRELQKALIVQKLLFLKSERRKIKSRFYIADSKPKALVFLARPGLDRGY
jgi:hypothetical protein